MLQSQCTIVSLAVLRQGDTASRDDVLRGFMGGQTCGVMGCLALINVCAKILSAARRNGAGRRSAA